MSMPRWSRGLLITAMTAVLVALCPSAATADPAPTDQQSPQDEQGLLAPFTPQDADGIPLDHYDITGDAGGMTDWDRKLLLFMTDSTFAANKLLVGACSWLLEWAFEFGPAEALTEPARSIAATYQNDVIDRLGLPNAFLLLGAAWCGVLMMRGRTSQGAGELAVTLLVSALAVTVLARPADLLLGEDGLLNHTRDTAMALTSVTVTQGESASTDPDQAAQPLTDVLVDTFVVQPHQALNYGEIITADDPCHTTYRNIVADGPWGDDAEPRDRLTEAGCKAMADYNADPSIDRLLGSYLLLGASFIVSVLILLLVCVLLIAGMAAGIFVVLCPFALVAALLPGGGRQLLWRWIGGVVKVLLSIIAICLFLAIFTVFVQALITASGDLPLVGRFALVDIAALGGLVYHRKLLNAGNRASQRLSRRLETARWGGTRGKGWIGPTGTGGAGLSPVSMHDLTRGARSEFNRVAAPVQKAGRMAHKAWTGSPKARANAQRKLPSDASQLQQRLTRSRGGRVLKGSGKVAATVGKVAVGATVGAPIAVPKAAASVKAAAHARSAMTKAKLAKAAYTTATTGKQVVDAWAQTPPARTVREARAADADATRTRDILAQRRPTPHISTPQPGPSHSPDGSVPPDSSEHTAGETAQAPSANPHQDARSAAERLRQQIHHRRRPPRSDR